MADEQLIVSSAVVIPDQEPTDLKVEDTSSPTTLKRPHDNDEEEDAHINGDDNKRARLSPSTTKLSDQYAARPSTAAPPTQDPPTRRTSQQQSTEKTRNRRLFGNLQKTLAGIGQNVAQNVAAKKKEAVEKRAREKMVRMQEEDAESRRRRLDALRLERRREQVGYDGRAMRTRHRALRCEAGFLRTERSGGAGLFYLPWELRPHETERIRQQKDDVEDLIAREEADFERHVERETDELLELERRQLRDRERDEEHRVVKRETSVDMDRNGNDRDDDDDHHYHHYRRRSGSVNVEVNVNVAVNVNAVNGAHTHGLVTTEEHKPAISTEEENAPTTKGTIMEVEEAVHDDPDADTKMKVEEAVEEEALPVIKGILGDEKMDEHNDEDRENLEKHHGEGIDVKEAGSPHDQGDEMALETEEDTVLY